MKIGVFDSGQGGRVILDAIRTRLPAYDYLYYGDTANLPYGDKPEEVIRSLTRKAILELFARDVELVIIACNTASAESLRVLQDEIIRDSHSEKRILGVIIPTIEQLIESDTKHALLIGTKRTIASHKYETELTKRGRTDITLSSCATPELVPLIEAGELDKAYHVLESYLVPRIGTMDTLILGCTHYGVLKQRIRENYPKMRVIAQEEIIPEKLEMYLTRHSEIKKLLTKNNSCEYILTGN